MTVTKDEFGKQNMFAVEPEMYIDQNTLDTMNKNEYVTHNEKAEKLNGRLSMLGIVAALGAYALTGQIIPGVW